MSYHAIGGLLDVPRDIWDKLISAAPTDECPPDEEPRWCALLARKNAEFAAAANAGMTPEQWYDSKGITPEGSPIPKMPNTMLILGGVAAVAFLATRKK